MAFKHELSNFAQNTSVKGVSRLLKADSNEIKLLWTVAILICFTIGTYQTFLLFEEFFSYAKVTRIKEHKFRPEVDFVFPNVQVCSLNPGGLLRNLPPNETVSAFINTGEPWGSRPSELIHRPMSLPP